MDPRVQKTIIPYDIESLKNSIEKHEENIKSLEVGIESERKAIMDEQMMIATLEARQKELE
jgi:hypothetical protein